MVLTLMPASFVEPWMCRNRETRHARGMATLARVHDDLNLDDEFVDESEEDDAALEDDNGHTLSIRRASGEEVVSIFSPTEEWSVYLQPGGGMTNAFVGRPTDPIVWVNTDDRRVERDEDGTYVIRID
jgi:hypothetical protein